MPTRRPSPLPPSVSFPLVPAPRPAKFLATPARPRPRLVEAPTLGWIVYEHEGAQYVRIKVENALVHLIDIQTRKPMDLDKKTFDRMLGQKKLSRRLCLVQHDSSNAVLGEYFKSGPPLGEFIMVNTVRCVPSLHKPSSRPISGRRFKRLG